MAVTIREVHRPPLKSVMGFLVWLGHLPQDWLSLSYGIFVYFWLVHTMGERGLTYRDFFISVVKFWTDVRAVADWLSFSCTFFQEPCAVLGNWRLRQTWLPALKWSELGPPFPALSSKLTSNPWFLKVQVIGQRDKLNSKDHKFYRWNVGLDKPEEGIYKLWPSKSEQGVERVTVLLLLRLEGTSKWVGMGSLDLRKEVPKSELWVLSLTGPQGDGKLCICCPGCLVFL